MALEIIGRKGLTALTTTALAEAIGVTSGALFRHFASREAILDEAVAVAETRIEATFPDAALPPLDRLRALAEARIALLSSEPGLAWLLRSGQAPLALPPAGVKRLRGLVRRSRAYIQTALDEARGAGQLRTDVPQDVLILTFTATVHALIAKRSVHARGTRAPKPEQAVQGLLTLLAPPKSPKRTKRKS